MKELMYWEITAVSGAQAKENTEPFDYTYLIDAGKSALWTATVVTTIYLINEARKKEVMTDALAALLMQGLPPIPVSI